MFFVYIMASQKNGTIYIGQTNDLQSRIFEHREGLIPGFTKLYNCNLLVWFEWHETPDVAFQRERRMKAWKRAWKIRQIEKLNPGWEDLYPKLNDESSRAINRKFNPEYL